MSQDRISPELLSNRPQHEREPEELPFSAYDQPTSSRRQNQAYLGLYAAAGCGLLLFITLVVCSFAYFFGGLEKTVDTPLQATLILGKDAKVNVGSSQWITLLVANTVNKDNIVKTGSDKVYVFELPEGATLRAAADTIFKLNEAKREDEQTFVDVILYKGMLFADDTSNTKIRISTKYCNIVSIGTKYGVCQQKSQEKIEQTLVRVCQGSVAVNSASNPKQKFTVKTGEQLEFTKDTILGPYRALPNSWITWNAQLNTISEIKNDLKVKVKDNTQKPKHKKKKKKKSIPVSSYSIKDDTDNLEESADFQRFRDSRALRKNDNPADSGDYDYYSQDAEEDYIDSDPYMSNDYQPDSQNECVPPQAVPAPPPLPAPPKRTQVKPRYEGNNYTQSARRSTHKQSAYPKVRRNMPRPNIPPVQVAPPPDIPELPKVGGTNVGNNYKDESNAIDNKQKDKKNSEPKMRLDANGFMYPEHDFEGAATNKSGDPLDAITDTSKDVLKAKPPSSKALDAATYR